jgi:hypothetical protein
MRALVTAFAAASLLMLSAGISIAGAVSGPNANANGRLDQTEEIVASDLVVNFDEGGQRPSVAVDYRLDATLSAVRFCDGQGLGEQSFPSATVTGLTATKGHAVGSLTLEGPGTVVCSCGCSQGTLTVDYTNVTLTNITTGRVYRLEPISQEYSTS